MKKLLATLLLLAAPVAAQPYTASDYITGWSLTWGTHEEDGAGSDNWPLTWHSGGDQFAAWGDGGGFAGTGGDCRVSLGIAQIAGTWASHTETDLWGCTSGCAECVGNGWFAYCGASNCASFDGKSYGIISVNNGDLYAWWGPGAGQTSFTETRLIRSLDDGASWSQSSWNLDTQDSTFMMPTVVNTSQDHDNAPDSYVYFYYIREYDSGSLQIQSGGAPDAGRIDLARTTVANIWDETQHEYFTGSVGSPSWSTTATSRVAVFTDTNGVGWTVSVWYSTKLSRYILITEHTTSRSGCLGVFEAPDPWGPWQTVEYYTCTGDDWFGFGKGDSGNVPQTVFYANFSTKWTDEMVDDEDFVLSFSGTGNNDSWNALEGTFTVDYSALDESTISGAALSGGSIQ